MASPFKQACHRAVRASCRSDRSILLSSQRAGSQQFSSSSAVTAPAPPQSQQNLSRDKETEEIPANFDLGKVSSLAHAELETHRELRALARTAAWEMPLLSALSKPFEPPTTETPLRWRYTTYMGEQHPAANKVTVEFSIHDIRDLTEAQKTTLKKIAGPRWDPKTDVVKMGCESFENQAQNKRYLGETIQKLIKEAKEGEDKFEDVPLDVRHAKKRDARRRRVLLRSQFPKEWRLTPERKAELERKRGGQPLQIDAGTTSTASLPAPSKTEAEEAEEEAFATVRRTAQAAGETLASEFQPIRRSAPVASEPITAPADSRPVISGVEAIEAARQAARQAERERASDPVMVNAERPLARGRSGKFGRREPPGRP